MKIKLVTGSEFHVEATLGAILCELGLATQPTVDPVRIGPPQTSWSVGRSDQTGELWITAKCATCRLSTDFAGPTAHKSQRFSHCRVNESVPLEIAEQYEKLLRKKAPAVEPRRGSAAIQTGPLGEINYVQSDPAEK